MLFKKDHKISILKTGILALAVLLFAACTPVEPGAGDPPAAEALPQSTWYLAAIGPVENPAPVLPNHLVTLEFGPDNSVGGSAGCNSFGGKYTLAGEMITFSSVVSTLMACLEPGLMEQEAAYLAALGMGGRLELSESRLSILYGDGQVLQFTAAPPIVFADTPTPAPSPDPSPTPDPNVLCSMLTQADAAEWMRCENPFLGFAFDFPAGGSLAEHTATRARIDLPFAPDTTLLEKYLQIDFIAASEPCSSPFALGFEPGAIPAETVTIGGVEFVREEGIGAAAGNRYDWIAYSTPDGPACISIGLVLHSFSQGVMENPPPEFDREAEIAVLEPIIESFRWLFDAPAPSPTDTPAPTLPPDESADRIRFETGAISAVVSGELGPAGSHLYVLYALEGQTMTVDLDFAAGKAILVIWGADGQPLLTDHAEVSNYEVVLPASQDYYILVKAHPEDGADYTMTVTIPPPE